MTRDFARKCSHCGHNGHNSRTCNNGKGCFKLFGVKINLDQEEKRNLDVEKTEKVHESMRKSKSMGNLLACNPENNVPDAGYLSDGIVHKSEHERKKGVPWAEDEHRSFLTGLEHLGKGDWRGISKNYVPTRTPTQVASHAQKYFIRKTATDKRKRRSSLFDIPFNESTPPAPQASIASPFDKASEISQQVSATVVASSKNSSKNQGQASTSAHVAPSEKPPLSPMARTYVPDFYRMPYMVQVPGGQSFPAADVVPTVFFPYMNYPNPGYVYFPPGGEMFPACAPYMNQMSSGPLPGPFPLSHGSSEAGSATSAAKKDGLEASIGALSI